MGGRFVVFGGGMERESAGPVDWMERRDTGKEFESGGGQQSLFNCAAVARAASGLARVRSGAGPGIRNYGGAPGVGGSRVWKRGFERPAFESASGRDRAGFLRAAAGADSASMPESGQNEGGVSIL